MAETRRILVVDDDQEILNLLEELLTAFDFEILRAGDGLEAVKTLKEHRIDMILTDMYMPKINGIELITRIRKYDDEVPIILLTGHSTVDLTISALRAGATNFIVKPFDVKELMGIINKVFRAISEKEMDLAMNTYMQRFSKIWELPSDEMVLAKMSTIFQNDLQNLGIPQSLIGNYVLLLQEMTFNALYHGNLELTSEIREDGIDGQLQYQEEVHKRLNDPHYNARRILVEYWATPEEFALRVQDDGPGFDWQQWLSRVNSLDSLDGSGRGLLLVKSFARKLEFNESGNDLTIYLALNDAR